MSSAHLGLGRAEGEEWKSEVGGGVWEEKGKIRSDLVGLWWRREGAEGSVEVVEVLRGVGCIMMDNLAMQSCGVGAWEAV